MSNQACLSVPAAMTSKRGPSVSRGYYYHYWCSRYIFSDHITCTLSDTGHAKDVRFLGELFSASYSFQVIVLESLSKLLKLHPKICFLGKKQSLNNTKNFKTPLQNDSPVLVFTYSCSREISKAEMTKMMHGTHHEKNVSLFCPFSFCLQASLRYRSEAYYRPLPSTTEIKYTVHVTGL